MALTYVALATVTVGSGGSSTIDFTSLGTYSAYNHLILLCSLRNSAASTANSTWLKFNSATTNYEHLYVAGDGGGTGSAKDAAAVRMYVGEIPASTAAASNFGSLEILIPNFSGANYKSSISTGVAENNTTTAYSVIGAGLWKDTNAITSVGLISTSGTFVQHSKATLYGIKNS